MSPDRPVGAPVSPVENRCHSAWVCLAVAAIVLVVFRLHVFGLPLETDECNYAYIASRLIEGDRLYEDVWDHQPPGVFVMFAGVIAVFGQSDLVFRCLATCFSLASLALIFHIARRHYGLEAAALAAAVFAITSSDPGAAGEGCNREIYMNVLALGAFAALANDDHPARRRLLLAGLLLGLGSALKTVVAAQWLLLVIWAAARAWARQRRLQPMFATIVWISIGPALVWTSVFLHFGATGRWAAFIDAAFAFNVGYSGVEHGFFRRYVDFATVKPYVFHSGRPLWIAAAVAVPALIVLGRRRLTSIDGGLLAYAFGSFQAVCLPGHFWPHYYYLLIPPLILVCAATAFRISELEGGSMTHPTQRAGVVVVRVAAIGWVGAVLVFALRYYLLVDPLQVTAPRYDYRQQWGRAQGHRIATLTDPDDTVFVWGKDAGVYYYSRRRCASRYTMVGALGADARGHQERRRTLMRELQSHRPRLVLIVEEEFAQLRRFLEEHYVVAGVDRDDDNPEKIIMIALMDRDRPVKLVDWEWRAPRQVGKFHRLETGAT